MLVWFSSGALIMGIILQGVFLANNLRVLQTIQIKHEALQNQIQILSTMTKRYGSYRDLYLQLATLEYRLGDITQAKAYTDQALAIDPNFKETNDLEAKLQ
jgi:tetratricopeptide (TPR) repeat protein